MSQLIHSLVRQGRITPAQVLQLRAELAYARKPWWERVIYRIARLLEAL